MKIYVIDDYDKGLVGAYYDRAEATSKLLSMYIEEILPATIKYEESDGICWILKTDLDTLIKHGYVEDFAYIREVELAAPSEYNYNSAVDSDEVTGVLGEWIEKGFSNDIPSSLILSLKAVYSALSQ